MISPRRSGSVRNSQAATDLVGVLPQINHGNSDESNAVNTVENAVIESQQQKAAEFAGKKRG